MNWKELEAIQLCYTDLVGSVDPPEIMAHLIQQRAVTAHEKESIDAAGPRHKQAEKLLEILTTSKRSGAFSALCLGLQNNLQYFLVDKLLRTMEELETRGPPRDWLVEDLTDAGRARQVTEVELSQVAQEMGGEWMSVGIMMGFKQGRLEQFQAAYPYHVPNQISKMFMEWRSREGSLATIENLVRIFRNCKVREEVYKDIILEHSRKPDNKYAVL